MHIKKKPVYRSMYGLFLFGEGWHIQTQCEDGCIGTIKKTNQQMKMPLN